MPVASLDTPVGRLTITEADGRIDALSWTGPASGEPTPLLAEALDQLRCYFAGDLDRFDLPFTPAASDAEAAVRAAMLAIPHGGTVTYGDIGKATGLPAQAVGQACARNPLPIIVPCHRVVGVAVSGHYSGGGGATTKHWLLRHEGATLL